MSRQSHEAREPAQRNELVVEQRGNVAQVR
jgi:hypothetical protein